MTRRTTLLLAALAISSIALYFRYPALEEIYRDSQLRSPQSVPETRAKEKSFFEEIALAESVADPLERCKAVPIPKEAQWTQATVDAFCLDVNLPSIGWNEVQASITEHSAQLLDARFDRLLDAYFAGEIAEGTMRWAYYGNFNYSTAEEQRVISQWLAMSPNSAHAHAASGLSHLETAFEHRGTRFIADTPKIQLEKMKSEVVLAKRDLEKALEINPRIMPAYEALIDCERLNGSVEKATSYLHQAQLIDPSNYYTLFGYSILMEPRWGGSMQQLDAIAETARQLIQKNPRMANLIASTKTYPSFGIERKITDREEQGILQKAYAEGLLNVTLNRYATVSARLGDHRKAYEIYTQALRLSPNDAYKLSSRASEAMALGAYDYARRDIDAAQHIDPMNIGARRNDAYLDLLTNKYLDAEKKLKILLSVNYADIWALEQLAWIAVFRTQNVAQARLMIDRGFAISPQSGSFHWLNWELIRRSGRGDLPAATADFIAHVDKTDPRQVEALQYAK